METPGVGDIVGAGPTLTRVVAKCGQICQHLTGPGGWLMRTTRPVSWLEPARKAFEAFPDEVRQTVFDVLTLAAEGGKARTVKPLKGLGSGVMESALRYRGDAFRVIYALQLDDDIWVVHAFQKKSKSGIGTPRNEVVLIKDRLKRLKDML